MKIKENTNGMSQNLTNQAVLIMPQVMGTGGSNVKPLGEMRANGFNVLTPATTNETYRDRRSDFHIFSRRGNEFHEAFFRQLLLAQGIQEAFVGWHDTFKAFNQVVEEAAIMWSGRQKR